MHKKITKKADRKIKTKLQYSKQSTKGITLIALVVTIVVLLILAGVSIVVLFGDNGMIKTAQESTLQTKFAEIEERANVIYADLDSKRYAAGNINKKVTMGEIAKELSNLKYDIKEIEVGENVVEAITLEPTNIKMGKDATAQIEVKFKKNDEGMAYYVKVEDKYYKISLENRHITLDRTNGKLENELKKNTNTEITIQELNVSSKDENIVTIKSKDEKTIEIQSKQNLGSTQIEVSYGSLEPQICNVTVAIRPIEGIADVNNSITTNYGRIDVIWLDENNKVILEPNKPILESEENGTVQAKTKMRAVKWVDKEEGTIEEAPADETNPNKEWYDYREKDIEEGVAGSELANNNTSHWANAKTENGSYFVWIPRYAYRITYYANETSTTPTGYYDGNGMWSAEDGKKKCDLEEGIETVEHNGELYIVHPAFGTTKTDETSKTQNIELGGWDKPLTGFWFAKFEMSYTTEEGLKSVPGVESKRSNDIGGFYTMARTATYNQKGTADNTANDEITEDSFMNSHMMKNSEWGAVAYLTHSQYGRNGHEITINGDSTYYTGGANSNTAYLSNQNQSTTGNAYGVYDMSGGAAEYTATFNGVDTNNYFTHPEVKWTESTKLTTESTSTKYVTKYNNDSTNATISFLYNVCKTGDATKEVNIKKSINWFEDAGYLVTSSYPFMFRGGKNSHEKNAGVFYLGQFAPNAGIFSGCLRVVLIPFHP